MDAKKAESVALAAVQWLAGNDEMLPLFLQQSGGSAADLGEAIGDQSLWLAVLDFMLMDDAMIRDFAASTGVSPDLPLFGKAVFGRGGSLDMTLYMKEDMKL